MSSTDTSPLPAKRMPKRPPGCLIVLSIAIACVVFAAVVVVRAVVLYDSGAPPLVSKNPSSPSLLTPSQLASLPPLKGTWKNKAGAQIIFTNSKRSDMDFLPGNDGPWVANGTVTFVNVPLLFTWRWGPVPPSSGQGLWSVMVYSASGPGSAPDDGAPTDYAGGGIVVWFGGRPIVGQQPSAMFLVEGSVSDPVLVCNYPTVVQKCIYSRQS